MLIKVKRGLDVPMSGAPEQVIFPGQALTRLAVLGMEHVDLRPSLRVSEGDVVVSGQALFVDRADARVCFVAPAAGRVVAIHRGARRSLQSVVLALEDGGSAASTPVAGLAAGGWNTLSRDNICAVLCQAGLWPALRARPYGRIAPVDGRPRALFVTAIDTQPLAADPRVVIAARADEFHEGLDVLSRLAPRTWLCHAPGERLPYPEKPGLQAAAFAGPHPAGLVGTHLHHLASEGGPIWHVSYQDVLAIGHLFRTGALSQERVIALAGSGVRAPRLVSTCLGADLSELLAGEILPGARVLCGSVLTGREATLTSGFLGRFDHQISVLAPSPVIGFGSALRAMLMPSRRVDPVATRGSQNGMVPIEAFDRVWPFPRPPAPLLRALLMRDTQTASALGCLALAEEDLALCTYACPGKLDYGVALRSTLRELERGR